MVIREWWSGKHGTRVHLYTMSTWCIVRDLFMVINSIGNQPTDQPRKKQTTNTLNLP